MSAARTQALSPVGRCKTFDASGDGYGRGEGFAVALLRCASGVSCTGWQLVHHCAYCAWYLYQMS